MRVFGTITGGHYYYVTNINLSVRDAFPIISPAYAVHSSPSQAGDASRHAKYYLPDKLKFTLAENGKLSSPTKSSTNTSFRLF